ncbi:unnamed protein product [Amaranthus hypochondriacus]
MYSNNGVGMLGLEMPLHQSTQPQNPQHQQMIALTQQQYEQQQQTQLSMKQPTNNLSYNNQNNPNPYHKPKTQITQLTNSDEDEPISTNDHDQIISMERKRKGSNTISPWQRMKWTDNMVRLLIMAVYYIGDEAGNEIGSEKKKPGLGSGGLLQKKGKWKSVSKAMMEKGFYVSPQQCEDKFNDLNKRYKRVNDILGKGTSCKVVENQNLLESMDLNPKLKEEVRKLLNSKHLFFREMCAYHNSCSHGSVNPSSIPNHQQNHQKQESCSHSAAIPAASIEPEKIELGLDNHDDEDEEDDDDEHEDDEFDDDEDQDELVEGNPRKRARISYEFQELNGEIMEVLQNRGKTSMEKKQWMMIQLVKFEEKGLKLQFEALKLENERLKWIRFSSKKEREMEKMKIENERKRLENERMMLLLKQKEIELVVENHPQHQHQHQQYPPTNQS